MAALGALELVYRRRLFRSRQSLTSAAGPHGLQMVPLGGSLYLLLRQSRQETKAQQFEVALSSSSAAARPPWAGILTSIWWGSPSTGT